LKEKAEAISGKANRRGVHVHTILSYTSKAVHLQVLVKIYPSYRARI